MQTHLSFVHRWNIVVLLASLILPGYVPTVLAEGGMAGTVHSTVPQDQDADFIPDERDNCPDVRNTAQLDWDGDGIGNVCDASPGSAATGPLRPQPANMDRDGDLVPDNRDNCPDVRNTAQLDWDGDGIGNTCDDTPGSALPGGVIPGNSPTATVTPTSTTTPSPTATITATPSPTATATATPSPTATATTTTTPSPTATATRDDPQPSVSITKTALADSVIAGKPIAFTITVHNAGEADATAVAFVDTLPSGNGLDWNLKTPVAGCQITGAPPAASLSCNGLTVPAHGGELSVQVISDTDETSCASYTSTATLGGTYAGEATATVTVSCPSAQLSISHTPDNGTITGGQDLAFTIAVENTGIIPATNVVVFEYLPAGLAWELASGPGTFDECQILQVSTLEQALYCSTGSLPAGEQRSVSFLAHTQGLAMQGCGATVSATALAQATNATQVSDSGSIHIQCARLSFSVTPDNVTMVLREDYASFTYTLTNTGELTARNVTVADQLPVGSDPDSPYYWTVYKSKPNTLNCSILGNYGDSLTCSPGDLPPGASVTATVVAGNIFSRDCGLTLFNDAAVASADNAASVSDSGSISVSCANIAVSMTPDQHTVTVGEHVEFVFTVTNTGGAPARNIQIDNPLPSIAIWELVDASECDDVTFTGPRLTCQVAELAPSKSVSVTVRTVGAMTYHSCGTTYTNEATATAENNGFPAPITDSGTATVKCNPSASCEITIALTWTSAQDDLDVHLSGPQDDGRFHVSWQNHAPVDFAGLDHNATFGPGAEAITVRPAGAQSSIAGQYRIWVHHSSGSDDSLLSDTGAVVTVSTCGNVIAQFAVGDAGGFADRDLWYVFFFDLTADSEMTVTPVQGYREGDESTEL